MKSTLPTGSPAPWQVLAVALGGGCLLALYLTACHVVTTQRLPWALWLYLAPLLAMLGSALISRWGSWWGGAAGVVVLGVLVVVLPRWQGDQSVLYVAQHVCTNLALCWMFGYTLVGGREPLVTRFARIVRRGDMPPEVIAFTRSVTQAWTLFFLLVAAVSLGLYGWASIQAWSTFANLICTPLVGLMFVGEYAVRRHKLRGIKHSAFLDAMHVFRQSRPVIKPGPHP